MKDDSRSRRRFLQTTGAAGLAGLAAVAGCSGQSPDDANDSAANGSTQSANQTAGDGAATDEPAETDEPVSDEAAEVETTYKSREKYNEPGELLDDFTDLSTWLSNAGELEPSSEHAFRGDKSAKLVGKGGDNASIARSFENNRDLTKKDFSLALRSTTPSKFALFVYLRDPFGNYAVLELRNITMETPDVGWFRTAPGVYETSNTPPDLTQISRIEIVANNATGDDIEVWVDDLRIHDKPDKGYIVFSWDDGRKSYYDDAAPLHDEFEVPAVQAAVPRFVGQENFMTLGELKERHEAGDEIVAHESIRNRFHSLSGDELEKTVRQNKQWLLGHGFEGSNFVVYPGNDYDATALDVVNKYHYMGGMNQSFEPNTTSAYAFDPLVLPRTVGHDLDISKRVVDLCAEHQNVGILNFHDFNNDNTMSKGDYRKLLEHVTQKEGIEVINFSDLWKLRKSAP
ncbi:polysaccharide deacetylase family protein [Haloprofundus salinisoli]|uniref:polysaccharide deacetylase family protein n=1 Tax=Haloprofundus salinisoli TaxID=2876193 RepID=UPI001CCB2F96|nr:polysaccharide deacetylase family protein [Haloprofundus salinisoli]